MEGERLTRVLKNLVRCDFVMSYQQYGNKAKGTIYRLMDFYSLFYYKFVTSFGVSKGAHYSVVNNEVLSDDLFC